MAGIGQLNRGHLPEPQFESAGRISFKNLCYPTLAFLRSTIALMIRIEILESGAYRYPTDYYASHSSEPANNSRDHPDGARLAFGCDQMHIQFV